MPTSWRTLFCVVVASLVFGGLGTTALAGMACLHNMNEAVCTTAPGEGMVNACKRLDDGACALIFLDTDSRSLPRSLAIIHVEGVGVKSLAPNAEAIVVRRSGEAGSHAADVENAYQTDAGRCSILSAFFEKISVYTSLVGLPGEFDGILECELSPTGEATIALQAAGAPRNPLVLWQAPVWRLKKDDVLLIPSPEKNVVVAVSIEWIRDTDLERTPRGSMIRLQQTTCTGVVSSSNGILHLP